MKKHLCSLIFLVAPQILMADPPPAAASAFDAYSNAVESRLAKQHQSPDTFVAPTGDVVERLTPTAGDDFPGAMLHHRSGATFASGAKATDFETLLRGFDAYPQHFSPQVLQARVLSTQGENRMQVYMRLRQRHILTVVMDATYDVIFGRLDAQHGYSISKSTRISEIDSPGSPNERVLNADEEHGFLWRLNTYWSYEERPAGLYLQIEAVSLTRSIPRGLGWMLGPYVESIPRESIEFTLRSVCSALQK